MPGYDGNVDRTTFGQLSDRTRPAALGQAPHKSQTCGVRQTFEHFGIQKIVDRATAGGCFFRRAWHSFAYLRHNANNSRWTFIVKNNVGFTIAVVDLSRVVLQFAGNQPITSQQSPDDFGCAADSAVPLQCIDRVLAATRMKAALPPKELPKGHAIQPHELDQQPRHKNSKLRNYRHGWGPMNTDKNSSNDRAKPAHWRPNF
jgi:hypothetical protein